MAPARFRVLYDFIAESDSDEISIKAGEVLWAVQDEPGKEIENGWIMVEHKNGNRGFVPLQYIEHMEESSELDQRESSVENGGSEEVTWAPADETKKGPNQEGSYADTVPHAPNYNDMEMSLYDLASNTSFLDHHQTYHEGQDEVVKTQPYRAIADDEILKPVDTSKLVNRPVDIKVILSSPAESVRGLPPPAPIEKVDLDRTLFPMKATNTPTPGWDRVAAQMRERSRNSCLVKPRFVSAVESGDVECLRQLTGEYFDGVEEGRLREAQVLAEIESLNVEAEDSTRAATALVRRVTDLEDLLEAEKARISVSLRRLKEEGLASKGRFLRTPKKEGR